MIVERTEELILNQLIHNKDYFQRVYPHLNDRYFQDKVEKELFCIIDEYAKRYSSQPTPETISILLNEKPGMTEDEVTLANEYIKGLLIDPVSINDLDFVIDETEKFCQDRAMYNAIIDSMSIIQGEDKHRTKAAIPDLMKDALRVSFNNDIGLEYADIEERYERMHREGVKIPFDIEALNVVTNGGVENKTLNCVLASTGVGKALRHGSKIITPNGDILIEDVEVGDKICCPHGTYNIIGVFPQGIRPIYRVTFSDGTYLDVDKDHLWTLKHQYGDLRTLSTADLIDNGYTRKDGASLYSLPDYNAVEYPEKEFDIAPYVLGCWLGDGSNYHGHICCPKGKIDESRLGDYTFNKKYGRYNVCGLQPSLKKCGLLPKNKYIPDEYFYGSVQQRQDLLDGLLDTDGCDSGMRGIEFTNSNEGLVDGVIRLARSLGYIAYRTKTKENPFYRDKDGNKIICKPSYRCRIKNPKARTAKRYLKTIEYIGDDYATCIMVDSPNHLFLAGDFIPTHNTIFMCHCAASYIARGLNVVYFTMEMAEEKIAQRIDANLLNIDLDALKELDKDTFFSKFKKVVSGNSFLAKVFGVKKRPNLGRLFIKEFPTSAANMNHIRAVLDDLKLKKDFVPDVIIIDYINICASTRVSPAVGTYAYVKAIAEEMRGLAVEYDVPVITATQTNRSGYNSSDIDMTDTSESIGLPETLDFFIALMSNDELQTAGLIAVKQLKNRYRDEHRDRYFTLGLDKPKMRFYHVDDWNRSKPEESNETLTYAGGEKEFGNDIVSEKETTSSRAEELKKKFRGIKI